MEFQSKKNHTILFGVEEDLIKVEGQINSKYENWTLAKRGIPFEFSDGTKGSILYDGDWIITVTQKGSLFCEIIPKVGDSGQHKGIAFKCTPYSDVLVLNDGISWVKINGKKSH